MDVFQCAENLCLDPSCWVVLRGSTLNFAHGWNDVGLNGDFSLYFHGTSSSPLFRSSVKMSFVVSPSDCVALGDTARWMFVNAFSRSTLLLSGTLDNPFLSSVTYSGLVPHYSFYLTRRHYGNANVAFLDGHVEAFGSLSLSGCGELARRFMAWMNKFPTIDDFCWCVLYV